MKTRVLLINNISVSSASILFKGFLAKGSFSISRVKRHLEFLWVEIPVIIGFVV